MTEVGSTERIAGALMGVAAGDALGATVEFKSPRFISGRFPDGHRDIIGGGFFGWRPGQGTDDTDLTVALARVYASGYSLKAAADAFLGWYRGEPRDIGSTTAAGLSRYASTGDPRSSGDYDDNARANGSLMRCIATGLVRTDPAERRAEAAEISAITHASWTCVYSCVAYCDMVAALVTGEGRRASINAALSNPALPRTVREVIGRASSDHSMTLDPTGYVLGSLGCAVHALCFAPNFEEGLISDVALGSDADTHGAITGGLLGAFFGISAIPKRWIDKLEYAPEILGLAERLADVRNGSEVSQ